MAAVGGWCGCVGFAGVFGSDVPGGEFRVAAGKDVPDLGAFAPGCKAGEGVDAAGPRGGLVGFPGIAGCDAPGAGVKVAAGADNGLAPGGGAPGFAFP
jgi:hypothetical protein